MRIEAGPHRVVFRVIPKPQYTQRTMIVSDRFRPSQSVNNSWRHLWCNGGRARFTAAVV